ncbi:hypothetical protein SDC9_156445 [bioreactor metagenome]|uniref:Uncharacterized protein n=1 Tax=bioreactor metagenome TaxID=1076179 RepID=A0A645F4R1_9ZZZZ
MPTSEEVEQAVKDWRKEQRLLEASFDSNDNTSIFCHALKCKLQTEELVQDLIKKSDGKYRTLLLAIKELLNNHKLDPKKHNVESLKAELLELQKKQVEDLFDSEQEAK